MDGRLRQPYDPLFVGRLVSAWREGGSVARSRCLATSSTSCFRDFGEELEAEKLSLLTDVEQRAYKSTEEDRQGWTEDTPEAAVYWTALGKMRFDDTQIAARAPENVRAKVRRLAAD